MDYKNKKSKNTTVESNNKYLKCKQNLFIKNTPEETTITTNIGNITTKVVDDYGISSETKNIILQLRRLVATHAGARAIIAINPAGL